MFETQGTRAQGQEAGGGPRPPSAAQGCGEEGDGGSAGTGPSEGWAHWRPRPQKGPHQTGADSGAQGHLDVSTGWGGEGSPAMGLRPKDPRLRPLPRTCFFCLKHLKGLPSLRIKTKPLLAACRAECGWPGPSYGPAPALHLPLDVQEVPALAADSPHLLTGRAHRHLPVGLPLGAPDSYRTRVCLPKQAGSPCFGIPFCSIRLTRLEAQARAPSVRLTEFLQRPHPRKHHHAPATSRVTSSAPRVTTRLTSNNGGSLSALGPATRFVGGP